MSASSVAATDLGKIAQHLKSISQSLDASCLARDAEKVRTLITAIQQRAARKQPFDRSLVELTQLLDKSTQLFEQRKLSVPKLTFDDALPIAEKRDDIAALMQKHQVVIVCGETGSGKTTQIPKIALSMGLGTRGLIGCTQPRRLAARSLASRLNYEITGSREDHPLVGYKIRFADKTSQQSLVKVMTDGILLAELASDPLLTAYDTLVIDEAHERSLNIDFLLGIIKRLLPKRPDLKLVVTSATIDTERFSQFFNGAPVIEVSGRTYPVDIRYRAELKQSEDDDGQDMNLGIVRAAEELVREGPGDILVFLPGEREIREAADELRRSTIRHIDILPLFSRLSNEEQDRIFKSGGTRRIVLATNVAETSLTVPGIRYVIDTGVARINRYDSRSKVERLLVEPISQASARQRAGRCGRVAAGICIRLYDELDFNLRAPFTTPEILRTSLAAVVLRMLANGLGDPHAFPFIEPPAAKLIDDGFKQLFELHALDDDRYLTRTGREMAKLPVDPTIARMLLASRDHHCTNEMLVIAAVMEGQDPRDRPQDKREVADERQAFFRDPNSDFLTLLNIWQWFQKEWDGKASNRAFIDACREKFLSHIRLREWRELHRQLSDLVDESDFKRNAKPANYEQLHKALLTGCLTQVGMKANDGDYYNGTRGLQFYVSPGSSLKKARPRWFMAGELQETTKIFARSGAKIEPEWIEQLATHLVTRTHFDPHWEKLRGEVMAYENVSLFGLIINPRKRVRYSPLNPERAREVFMQGALVEGELETKLPFLAHNLRMVKQVEELEHMARRQDVLVDDAVIYSFYNQLLPQDCFDQRSFEAWAKAVCEKDPQLLHLTREQLMRHGANSVTEELYPKALRTDSGELPLKYRFEPAHPLDGVTLTVPLAVLNTLDIAQLDWLVPGFEREKITWYFKQLPKQLRTRFMPVADYVTLFLESEQRSARTLAAAVAAFVKDATAETVTTDLWNLSELPKHLRMNIAVIDDAGKPLADGRDLAQLRAQLGQAAQLTFAAGAQKSTGIEKTGIKQWDFGDLPEAISFKRNNKALTGYPALVDEGDSVAIQLFDDAQAAAREMRLGVVRLISFELREQLKQLERELPQFNALAIPLQAIIPAARLKTDMLQCIAQRAFLGDDEPPRNAKQFNEQVKRAKTRLVAVSQGLSQYLFAIAQAWQETQGVFQRHPQFAKVVAECKTQRDRLVYPGFLDDIEWKRLEHMPRYLKALAYRVGKLREYGDRDSRHGPSVQELWHLYTARLERHRRDGTADDQLTEFRWLIEELRVSLFAQELRTPFPVSHKRLMKFWQDNVKQ